MNAGGSAGENRQIAAVLPRVTFVCPSERSITLVINRRSILVLVATAVVLFVALAVLAALAMLLGELGDVDGASLVRRCVVVDIVLLVVDLVCLLLAIAVRTVEPTSGRQDEQP